jgi:hypothetical protein
MLDLHKMVLHNTKTKRFISIFMKKYSSLVFALLLLVFFFHLCLPMRRFYSWRNISGDMFLQLCPRRADQLTYICSALKEEINPRTYRRYSMSIIRTYLSIDRSYPYKFDVSL